MGIKDMFYMNFLQHLSELCSCLERTNARWVADIIYTYLTHVARNCSVHA